MTFKILQVADAHFGEDPDGTWGPVQDLKSTKVIEAVLDEEKPDLVVFSGDEITGEGLQGLSQIQEYWGRVVKPCYDRGIRWTMVLGNHDVCQEKGCRHVVKRLEKSTAGNIALQQVSASGGRLNATVTPLSSAAEKLEEKRQKEEERRKAMKEGLKKEKEAEERLARIMGEGVRDMYPEDEKEKKEEEMAETARKVAEADETGYDYTPDDTAAAPSVPDVAPVPSDKQAAATVKRKALGVKPDREPRSLVGVRPDPTEPPMRLNGVPKFAQAREQFMKYDTAYTNSFTAREGVFISESGGVTNYYLRLFKDEQNFQFDIPSAVLWFLDSGGGDLPEMIKEDQVSWLQTASQALKKRYGPLPNILYMHIPSKEFLDISAQDKACFGFEDDFITPVVGDQGLLAALAAAEIDWLMVGHDHGNDFCCPVQVTAQRNVHLCFGRHTGWGGYATAGMHTRGARVLEIDLSLAAKFLYHPEGNPGINSWVRLESGKVAGSNPKVLVPDQ